MKKNVATVILIVLLLVTGCKNSDTNKMYPNQSHQSSSETIDTDEQMTDNLNQDDGSVSNNETPGLHTPSLILSGVSDWIQMEKGIISSKSYNWDEELKHCEDKDCIKHHDGLILQDGSIIGYFEFVNPQSVKKTSKGDEVYGVGVECIQKLISNKAKSEGKEYYIDSSINWSFFIIADQPNDFVGYYMCCKMGDFPD